MKASTTVAAARGATQETGGLLAVVAELLRVGAETTGTMGHAEHCCDEARTRLQEPKGEFDDVLFTVQGGLRDANAGEAHGPAVAALRAAEILLMACAGEEKPCVGEELRPAKTKAAGELYYQIADLSTTIGNLVLDNLEAVGQDEHAAANLMAAHRLAMQAGLLADEGAELCGGQRLRENPMNWILAPVTYEAFKAASQAAGPGAHHG